MNPRPIALIGLSLLCMAAFSAEAAYLNDAPRHTPEHALMPRSQARVQAPVAQFSVNTQSRQEVAAFFQARYPQSVGIASGWNGSVQGCNAGNTTQEYKAAVLLRVNFFRALAGVPAWISFDTEFSGAAQEAALMMSANNDLSHTPPVDWLCYGSVGAEAAGNSNLAIGAAGAGAIDLYMEDSGTNNRDIGHRRWVLYPQTQVMGTGDVTPGSTALDANALWVFDAHFSDPRPTVRDEFVAWPPQGYIPYRLVYRRWSFSWPGADFSKATVNMTGEDAPVAVTLEPVTVGFGENTLAWKPDIPFSDEGGYPAPDHDEAYTVTLDHVVIDGAERSFTYQVVVFDPARQDNSLYSCADRTATLVGTKDDDVLEGTEGDDVIVGLAGNDSIAGRGGDDVICGNRGRDLILGGGGNDRLYGGIGKDTLEGENGDDVLKGGRGQDSLDGGEGTDKLGGGAGLDACSNGEVVKRCEIVPAEGDATSSATQ